jgi:hypothetical protein
MSLASTTNNANMTSAKKNTVSAITSVLGEKPHHHIAPAIKAMTAYMSA